MKRLENGVVRQDSQINFAVCFRFVQFFANFAKCNVSL